MKNSNKSLIITIISVAVFLLLAITNPKKEDHINEVNNLLMKSLNSNYEPTNNKWENLGSSLGLALGQKVFSSAISSMISVDNYVFFSLTKLKLTVEVNGKTERTIGYGILGNVKIFDEVSEFLNKDNNKKSSASSLSKGWENKSKTVLPKDIDEYLKVDGDDGEDEYRWERIKKLQEDKVKLQQDSLEMANYLKNGNKPFELKFILNTKHPIYQYADIFSYQVRRNADLSNYYTYPIQRKGYYLVSRIYKERPLGYVQASKVHFENQRQSIEFQNLLLKNK